MYDSTYVSMKVSQIHNRIHRIRKYNSGLQGQMEKGMRSYYLIGTAFQFWKNEKILEMDGGDAHTPCELYLISLNCTLKNG